MTGWRWPRGSFRVRIRIEPLLITLIASLPVLWAGVDGIRAGWWPLGDEALTGLAAYDVLTGHPLVMGPRTTTAFETGIESHHPGPILYYLLAPTSALSQGAPWGLILGSVLITVGVIAVGVHAADRVGGALAATAVGTAFLGLQWALGPEAGARPFNPYPPAFAVVTFLVLTWALLGERLELTPHYVVITSLMAQSHIGYLPFLVGPVAVLVFIGLLRWGRRRRTLWPLGGWRPPDHGRFRWPARSAIILGLLMWLPPVVELFRFSPNNLQQVWAYIGADRGVQVPTLDALRFVVSLLAPVPGGMSAAVNATGHVGSHMTRQSSSNVALVVGVLVVLMPAAMVIASGSRVRRLNLPERARNWLPSRNEARAAWAGLIGLAALAVTVTRLPLSSAQSSWNYLQAWPVAFFVWTVVLTYVVRRVGNHINSPQRWLPGGVASIMLGSGLLATLFSAAPTRWNEGDGIGPGAEKLSASLSTIDARHEGKLHVTFDGDTLGAGYYVAPALAHAIKDTYAVHLPAVWSAEEDTDFRKSVTSPQDTAWVSIRAGNLPGPGDTVHDRSTVVTTVNDGSGHDYTLFVRGPDPS